MTEYLDKASAIKALQNMSESEFLGLEGFEPMPGGKIAPDPRYIYSAEPEFEYNINGVCSKKEGHIAAAQQMIWSSPKDYIFIIGFESVN